MLLNTQLPWISKLDSIESTTGYTDILVNNLIAELCTIILESCHKKLPSLWQHKRYSLFYKRVQGYTYWQVKTPPEYTYSLFGAELSRLLAR